MMTEQLPLVSIVIPVYNGSNFMREAIDSALNQTYANIEVIVVNDGSTDHGATREIALSYRDKIRYFEKENGGVSTALNYGIKQMRGQYFSWLSHDDVHLPQKVEKQMEAVFHAKTDKPVICVCNYIVIDEDGRELWRSYQDIGSYFVKSPKCFLGAEAGFMIDGDATLIDKRIFDQIGGFNTSLFASQETDMWYRALAVADFVFINDFLTAYRSHKQQVTNRKMDAVGLEAGVYRGNIVAKASLEEVIAYYTTSLDAVRFGESAKSYVYVLFYETVHQMLLKTRQLCAANWDLLDDVLLGMFRPVDNSAVRALLEESIVKEKNGKKKVLIYCNEHVMSVFGNTLAPFLKTMQDRFDFVVVYNGAQPCELPKGVSSLCFPENASAVMAQCLATLADLLNVDIFWANMTLRLEYAMALRYLRDSKMKKIASFHTVESLPSAISAYCEDSGKDALPSATLLTFNDRTEQSILNLYPYDSVCMPAFGGDTKAIRQWELLFTSLLESDDIKVIGERFTLKEHIDEKLLMEEALPVIRNYISQYREQRLEETRIFYENSHSWRITKPIRVLQDTVRKILK